MQVREIIQLKGGVLFTATPQQSLASAIDTMASLDVAGGHAGRQNGRYADFS